MLGKTARKFSKPRPTYKDALNPIQAVEMKTFLRALTTCSVIAKRERVQVDVGKCIDAYRNY